MRRATGLPHEGGRKSRSGFIALAIAILVLGCLGADLLGFLTGKVFGWS